MPPHSIILVPPRPGIVKQEFKEDLENITILGLEANSRLCDEWTLRAKGAEQIDQLANVAVAFLAC
jgi:hypothetical protein